MSYSKQFDLLEPINLSEHLEKVDVHDHDPSAARVIAHECDARTIR